MTAQKQPRDGFVLWSALALLAFSSVGLQSARGEDRWHCRATCVVVDPVKRTIEPVGSVGGRSEIDQDEAFQVMNQTCVNQAARRGYGPTAQIYLVHSIQMKRSEASSVSISQTTAQGRRFIGYRYRYDAVQASSSSEQSFEFNLGLADDRSCGPLKVTPGSPRYVGPGTPVG